MSARSAASVRNVVGLVAGVAILGIFVAERRRPLRRQTGPALRHELRNLAMGAMCAAVIATIETPATQAVARANAMGSRGLAGFLPRPFGAIVAVAAMDYGFYLWHVATHRLPMLWRFHRVHHVDPAMTMSTALRFHFVDMAVSLPWRLVQVRVSGITPRSLQMWQHFFTLSILFHHSNWALPRGGDERLSWLITTPRMHGIHHSIVKAERDSNWSSGISLWDRLHGTFRHLPPPSAITTGVDDRGAAGDVTIGRALRAPFRRAGQSTDQSIAVTAVF